MQQNKKATEKRNPFGDIRIEENEIDSDWSQNGNSTKNGYNQT
jgi:hypothetical protein